MGRRTVRAERSAMSGLSVLKRAECRSVKIPRPGRPSTSTNDDHVVTVRAVIRGNRRLTL